MASSRPYLREYDKILSMLPGEEREEPFYYDEKAKAYLLKPERFERMLQELSSMSKRRPAGEEPFYSFRRKGNRDCLFIKNYVGLLSLGKGLQIEVLPKVDLSGTKVPGGSEEDRGKLLHILVSMLSFLPDFPGRPGDSAYFQHQEMELREFFIGLYLRKVERLLQEGMPRSYRAVEEELPAPRGRLDVHKALSRSPGRLHRLPYVHDEYLLDNPENRLVKSTLLLLATEARSERNARKALSLLSFLENVGESRDPERDYLRARKERGGGRYEEILTWSRVFLLHRSFLVEQGDVPSESLLFPMEKVFESFVGRLLKEAARKEAPGWTVTLQGKGRLFDDPRSFEIRPDIRLHKDGRSVVLDTKWKRLSAESRNGGVSQADMYQMYAYGKRFRAQDCYLLYPSSASALPLDRKCYRTQSDPGDTNVAVHIRLVDLSPLGERPGRKGIDEVRQSLSSLLKECLPS